MLLSIYREGCCLNI